MIVHIIYVAGLLTEFRRTAKLRHQTAQFHVAKGSFYDKISVSLFGQALLLLLTMVHWFSPYSAKTQLRRIRYLG